MIFANYLLYILTQKYLHLHLHGDITARLAQEFQTSKYKTFYLFVDFVYTMHVIFLFVFTFHWRSDHILRGYATCLGKEILSNCGVLQTSGCPEWRTEMIGTVGMSGYNETSCRHACKKVPACGIFEVWQQTGRCDLFKKNAACSYEKSTEGKIIMYYLEKCPESSKFLSYTPEPENINRKLTNINTEHVFKQLHFLTLGLLRKIWFWSKNCLDK